MNGTPPTLLEVARDKTGKKMAMAIVGAYFLKSIEDWNMALLTAGLLTVGLVCQTAFDIIKLRQATQKVQDKE